MHGNPRALIPIAMWIAFLGVILEPPASSASGVVSPLFTSRPIQYLGRISYSVYLSHMLVIIVLQHALLVWAPQLSRMTHFVVLLGSTLAATITVSILLYRLVEVPGIKLGRSLARDFTNSAELVRARRTPSHNVREIRGPATRLYRPPSARQG